MQFKILSSLSLALIASLFLGCAKTNYDGGPQVHPLSNPQPEAIPQANPQATPNTKREELPPAPPTPIVASGNMPVISFVQNDVMMNGGLEAQLELQLSEAAKLPVTAVINLVDGSAIHYRDFAGFKSRGSETSQTLVFAPGKTRMLLPVIGGRRTLFCDTSFSAVISEKRLQNARVVDGSARITLPCEFVEPAPDYTSPPQLPAPIVEPRLPVTGEPSCPMVQARFESDVIENREHAKRTSVRIVLDRISDLPVIFDIETRDGSALQNVDYIPLRLQLTIPAGQTSIEIPVELLKAKRCRTPDMRRLQQHADFDFAVVLTAMSNANMAQPAARIIQKKDVGSHNCSN